MKTLPIILIIFVILALVVIVSVIVYAVRKRSSEFKEGLSSGSRAESDASTSSVVSAHVVEDAIVRRENLERVIALVRHRYEVSVSDVQDMLGFSRAVAEGYLVELSAKGVVELIGKTGRGEVFRIK